jgi:hypothetical protein
VRLPLEGQSVFHLTLPEYYEEEITLSAGNHTIEIFAHGEFLKTRTMAPLPNFVWCRISKGGVEIPLAWQARELPEYVATGLRISALLGWVEWRELAEAQNQPWREVASVKGLLELTGPLTKSELRIPKLKSFQPVRDCSWKVPRDIYWI